MPTTPYGLERISVHDEDTSTGKKQDPLYYLYDGMGRATELTKPTAQVSDKYRYDAFGVELPGGKMSPNAYKVLNNPFGYNGEQYDPEAGLSYLRNRYYEPETGRFMNRDLLPGYLMEPISMNAYAFVGNNPLQYMDPLGLDKIRRYRIVPELRQGNRLNNRLNKDMYYYNGRYNIMPQDPVYKCHTNLNDGKNKLWLNTPPELSNPTGIGISVGGSYAIFGAGGLGSYDVVWVFGDGVKVYDTSGYSLGIQGGGMYSANLLLLQNIENQKQYEGNFSGEAISGWYLNGGSYSGSPNSEGNTVYVRSIGINTPTKPGAAKVNTYSKPW